MESPTSPSSPTRVNTTLGIFPHTAASAMRTLRELFHEADEDNSGSLDPEELAILLRKYYKTEGTLRKLDRVKEEVTNAMTRYDTDNSGMIEFKEFIHMVCEVSGPWRLPSPFPTFPRVTGLSLARQHCFLTNTPSPFLAGRSLQAETPGRRQTTDRPHQRVRGAAPIGSLRDSAVPTIVSGRAPANPAGLGHRHDRPQGQAEENPPRRGTPDLPEPPPPRGRPRARLSIELEAQRRP